MVERTPAFAIGDTASTVDDSGRKTGVCPAVVR
jgi:hypothetical protein